MVPIGDPNPTGIILYPGGAGNSRTLCGTLKITGRVGLNIIRKFICMWLYYGTGQRNGTPALIFFAPGGWVPGNFAGSRRLSFRLNSAEESNISHYIAHKAHYQEQGTRKGACCCLFLRMYPIFRYPFRDRGQPHSVGDSGF